MRPTEEIGRPMNIAVVDAGSNLIAHVRMDKAWTARAFDISTKELAELSEEVVGAEAF